MRLAQDPRMIVSLSLCCCASCCFGRFAGVGPAQAHQPLLLLYQLLGSLLAQLAPPFRWSPSVTGTRRSRPGRPTAHAIRMGTCPSSSAAACGSWRRHRRSPSGTAGTWCTAHSSTCSADRDAARDVKPACLATQKTGLPRQWSECGGAHLIGVREARVDRRRLRPVGDERLLDGCHVILVAHGARGGCGNPERAGQTWVQGLRYVRHRGRHRR